jgi:hypothetical protein
MQNPPQSGVRDPQLIAARHNDGTTTASAVEGSETKPIANDATAILALLHEMNHAIAAISSQIASVESRVASVDTCVASIERRLSALDEGLVVIRSHAYASNVHSTASMAALEELAGPLGCSERVGSIKATADRVVRHSS